MVEFSWNNRSTSMSKSQTEIHQVMPPTTWKIVTQILVSNVIEQQVKPDSQKNNTINPAIVQIANNSLKKRSNYKFKC